MARVRTDDQLQSFAFWLCDISPNLNPPFFALDPALGFAGCGGVEINVTHTEYRPVDRMFPVHMPESASVAPITLRRGALLGVFDFYRWIDRHRRGEDRSRRNLLLVHFMTAGFPTVDGSYGNNAHHALRNGKQVTVNDNAPDYSVGAPFANTVRIPARAWVLWNCVPTRYNGGDFDASSGDVVVHELDVQPMAATQVDLGVI